MTVRASQLFGQDLDRYIDRAREDWGNVGLAVAIVRDGEVVYLRGFGVRQSDRAEGVDADTLFQVGSTTKAFTATALGMLVEEDRVRWDAPIVEFLPEFQLYDEFHTRNVTVRDALSHRSGIRGPYYFALGIMSTAEAVRQLRHIEPEAPFRNSYRYSNLMYAVAGKVIEAASGSNWGQFITQRLLEPLGMSRSRTGNRNVWDDRFVTPTFFGSVPGWTPDLTEARDPNVAMPHGWNERQEIEVLPWRTYQNAEAAGSMVCSAADMARWMVFQLSDDAFGGRRLISAQTLHELHAAQNPQNETSTLGFDPFSERYALGWRCSEYFGHARVAHGGGVVGFPAYVALLPQQKAGIAVLSNGPMFLHEGMLEYVLHKAIIFHAFDLLLDRPARDWNRAFKEIAAGLRRTAKEREEAMEASRRRDAHPVLPIALCTGTYQDIRVPSGAVHVLAEGGELRLRFAGVGAFSARLERWNHNTFRMRAGAGLADVLNPLFVTFEGDGSRRAGSMIAFDAVFQRYET